VNPRVGELRKHGLRIKLHDQPFQVLSMLLGRPGELVTREEIQKALWPSGTFVDFENGLNSAVNRLRDALGDSADEPRFIETVPRRGYRFIATVTRHKPAVGICSSVDGSDPLQSSFQPPSALVNVRSAWNRRLVLGATVFAFIALLPATFWRSGGSVSITHSMTLHQVKPVPLVTFAGGGQWLPAFSPDGSRIAYSWATNDGWYLEVKQLGSETRLRLTSRPAEFPPGPAWSPDGRQIAFVRAGEHDDRGIFVISALGGPERKLRSLSAWRVPQRLVNWSPDGHWIVFTDELPPDRDSNPASKDRRPNALFLIAPDTLETKQLTFPASSEFGDSAPSYSPDGSTIAFVHTTADSKDVISTISSSGGQVLPFNIRGIWTNGLAWSSDGKFLVFDRSIAGGFSLWKVSSVGGDAAPLDLPANRTNLLEPAIWRDRLAYESHESINTVAHIPLTLLPSDLPQSPLSSTRYDHAGRFSPQGDHIAFLSDRTGVDELWIADSDGSNPSQLTHLATPLWDVAWHPSGKTVALSVADGRVLLCSLETGATHLVFRAPPFTDEGASNLSFSQDGNFLYVLSEPGTGSKYDLLKVPLAGGTPEKMVTGILANFAESPDGHWLFYSNQVGIWKQPVHGGPSQFVLGAKSYWDIRPDGLYILTDSFHIDRFDFSGKRLNTVAKLRPFSARQPLSISPDGKFALLGRQERLTVEIDSVQGF